MTEALVFVGINILLSAALWGIGLLLRKPTHQEGPRSETKVQVSSYGIPKPILYGECKAAMQLIWATELEEVAVTEEVGKGGGDTITNYRYYGNWAGYFGVAPDPAIFGTLQLLKLWHDHKLIYTTDPNEKIKKWTNIWQHFRFYSGSEDQLPDSWMEAKLGVGNVPGYRRKCYGVYNHAYLNPAGNRIPTVRALVGPGTAAATTLTATEGATDDVDVTGVYFEEAVMVMSLDEMWIWHAHRGYTLREEGDYIIWRKISTYDNKVVAERIFYPDDPLFSAYRAFNDFCYLWYMSGDFDVDELNRIFAASACYVTRLDGTTFEPQLWTSVIELLSHENGDDQFPEQVRVSRNPVHPYLWVWQYKNYAGADQYPDQAIIHLLNRETLTNPFNEAENSYLFLPPAEISTGHPFSAWAGAINHDDGSLFVMYMDEPGLHTHNFILRRLYPDGRFDEWDMTSELSFLNDLPLHVWSMRDMMSYDSETNKLVCAAYDESGTDGKVFFIDLDTMTASQAADGFIGPDSHIAPKDGFKRGVVGGHLYFQNYYGKVVDIDVVNETAIELTDLTSFEVWNENYSGLYCSYKESFFTGMFTTENINVYEFMFGRLDSSGVMLDDVVKDICLRSGMTTLQIDVTDLALDVVKGYMPSQDQSSRAAIEPLMEAYIFDAVDVDGKLTSVKRGGASVATIPEDDLAMFVFGSEMPQPLEINLLDEMELPKRTEVFFPDQGRKHETNVQPYQRQFTNSKIIKRIDTPVLMDVDQAKQLAHISLKYDWTARPCRLSLGPKYAYLVPTDVITVNRTDGVYRVLLLEAQRKGLLTNWQGIVESIEYTSSINGTPAEPEDPGVWFPGPSLYQLMDLPPLLDEHNLAGVYVASGAMFEDWEGCSIHVSKDSGVSWTSFAAIGARSVTGIATAALGDFSNRCLDLGNTLTARWDYPDDVLASVTDSEFWQGKGHYLLVGNEIICARDVVTNADGTQTLSNLIRGVKGTEWAMTGHVSGETVVKLSTSTTSFIKLDLTYLNQSYLYNGVTAGSPWDEGARKIFTTALKTLKPWSPVQAAGTRDGSNNLTIEWLRRNRIFGAFPFWTGSEIPMSESAEDYEVDVLSGGTVVRTIDSLSSPSASYSAAEQTSDGLTPGDPVDCAIYQISATVGRGVPLYATV